MKITCPICLKKVSWNSNEWRPFCSERCKLMDLGAWASEEYVVPGEKKENGEKIKKKFEGGNEK